MKYIAQTTRIPYLIYQMHKMFFFKDIADNYRLFYRNQRSIEKRWKERKQIQKTEKEALPIYLLLFIILI